MIVKPILIVGAPRSGTSMLQKVLRSHPEVWSLPSESDQIWDRYCSPALRGWESEAMTEADLTPEIRRDLLRLFETYMGPARLFHPLERTDLIWGFRRSPRLRRALRRAYLAGYPLLARVLRRSPRVRFVEKTASNCFRLGFVDQVFPDARILYPIRHGYNNVNSLINGWLHPKRFFTYEVPEPLAIGGYPHRGWKFVLPPGWRSYTHRPLEEVCAFQWRACHEAMLEETRKAKYRDRVLRFKLEDLAREPERWLRTIAEFVKLPYDDCFRAVARDLPVVNSPDGDTSEDKWRRQHRKEIERVMPMIDPMLSRLDYTAGEGAR